MNDFEECINIVRRDFPLQLKENVLDFLSFLNSELLDIKRLGGYWQNQQYYAVDYKKESVCYILFSGTGEEKQFPPLTIWTDDAVSECYMHSALADNEKNAAWKHVDYCVNCGSCAGGTPKTIFGKPFDNVCRTAMRFINPDENELSLIKKLILLRKAEILGGNKYEDINSIY